MDGNGARLSIDFWHTTVRAAVRGRDGGAVAVEVDGQASMPTGVAVAEDGTTHVGAAGAVIGAQHPQWYVRLPGQRLFDERMQVGAVSVDPADLVAATLSRIARQAQVTAGGVLPGEVVICTPAHWVHRQQERLRVAARRAGLANPELLDEADAIVRDQIAAGIPLPVGAMVVVCRLDATVGEVVLLCRRPDRLERQATLPLGEVGQTAGASLVEQAAHALTEALGAVGIGGEQVSAVFCHAPAPLMDGLRTALPAAAGLSVVPIHVGDLSAASGGLHTTVPIRAGRRRWSYARLVHSLGGVAAGGFGAGLLAYQVFGSSLVYPATSISPKLLVTQWCAWGLASVFALLALVSAALVLADLRAIRHPEAGRPDGPDPRLGSAVMFAAAVGVGLAVVLALVGGASLGYTPTPLLAWTVGSTLAPAAVGAGLGLLATRLPMRGGWSDRLRFPVEATTVAALSTVSVVAAYTAIPFANSGVWWMLEHVGAVGIGVAIAWLMTRRPVRLVVLGALLGGPATFAISLDTVDTIGALLIAAVAVWWLVRLARIGVPMLSGLIGRATPGGDPPSGGSEAGGDEPG